MARQRLPWTRPARTAATTGLSRIGERQAAVLAVYLRSSQFGVHFVHQRLANAGGELSDYRFHLLAQPWIPRPAGTTSRSCRSS